MPLSSRSAAEADSWSRRGSAAVDAGDLETAKKCFARAAQLDRSDASRRFHLAIVLEALHEFGPAAEELTNALRIDPNMSDAARRLSWLCTHRNLPETMRLDALGLKAALRHDAVVRDTVAEMALYDLSLRDPLRGALELGRSRGWLAAARSLCVKKTGQLLRNELFLEILRTSVIRSPDLEHLLTSLRRVLLLEVPPQRFADRDLMVFGVALMQQCGVNEYVWAVSEDETGAIAQRPAGIHEAPDGGAAAGHKFLLASLYQPIFKTLGEHAGEQALAGLQPQVLREAVARHVAERADEQARLERLPRLGTLADDTSRKVAQQYEANPYPRWTRLGMIVRAGEFRRNLAQYIHPDRLSFMDQPFDVLVAGCGTGMHALQSAQLFGSNAQVLGIDLSGPSLAYASRMAGHFGVSNVSFMLADIKALGSAPEFLSRFRVIECGGVLHHMADPFQGWRSLIECLAPGGLMTIGLYSKSGRRNLAALRGDPAYPGPACSDAELRAFRQVLLSRADGEAGSELKGSPDFYTASSFRDLTLHVSEQHLSIPEIKTFLEDGGLAFRGFQPSTLFDLLREQYPSETWPGALLRWAELESAMPFLFAGMYKFWCERE